MAWVSPTGFNDPENDWTSEERAYDEDTTNYAVGGTVGYPGVQDTEFLELTHAALDCNKVRFWWRFGTTVDVDVYYENAWHDVFQGPAAEQEWVEKDIPAGTKSVTKARFRILGVPAWSNGWLYEFDFWEVPPVAEPYGIVV